VCALLLVGAAVLAWAAPASAQFSPATVSFDAAIPPGLADVARDLGVETLPPPERLLTDLARRLHEAPGIASGELVERLSRLETDPPAASPDVAPVPLSPEAWSRLLNRDITADNALAAILGDRRAALLGYGLAAVDAPTRRWLTESPALLAVLYDRGAPVFAAFGRSLQVRDGRVVTPGGAEAVTLWRAVVGTSPDQAALFAERLFISGDDGRLAYLYDTIGNLDEPRARFALGLWIAEDGGRLDRFLGVYDTVAGQFRREWHVGDRPFTRMQADGARALMGLRVEDTGEPAAPAWLPLWRQAFAGDGLPGDPAGSLRGLDGSLPFDATELLKLVTAGDPGGRAARLDTVAFAQRVFGGVTKPQAPDVLVALRARRAFPALMATLERVGLTDPALYAAAAHRAEALSKLKRDPAAVALRQFQGALALLARLRQRRVVDLAAADGLARSLIGAEVDGRRGYGGGVTAWLETRLFPALGWPADDGQPVEPRLLAALAGLGAAAEAGMPRFVSWEGHDYRVDIVAAERTRLARARERQGGISLDEALAVADAAARLAGPATSRDAQTADIELVAKATYGRPRAADPAAVVTWPPPVPAALGAVAALMRARTGNLDRVASLAAPLVDFGDVLVADVLASIAYAVALGDPDGRVLLGPNVAYRHDFGIDLPDGGDRRRTSWSLPVIVVQPGQPWHVSGSLLGLDVALSSEGLRRVMLDAELQAPMLNSNDRRTLVETVVLVNPFALTDEARDLVVGALARGRARVADAEDAAALDALAAEAGVDAWRRRELAWLAARGADDLQKAFSLAELVWLGRPPASADLAAWGVSAIPVEGCLCTWFPAPGDWRNYAGRAGMGLVGAQVADLTLRVAELVGALDLPAALTPYVLSVATLEFVDRVQPAYDDDWRTLVATARALTRERVEDYMATLAVGGPLIPDGDWRPEEERR